MRSKIGWTAGFASPTLLASLAVMGGVAGAPPLHGDEVGARLAALLRQNAPVIATVRIVAKTTVQMGGRSMDRESRMEFPGAVVDASGLVMTSIEPFAPERLMALLGGGGRGGGRDGGPQIKTVPTDIKVVFEQDEQEQSAFLAATDSDLGLAFLQVEGLAGRKLRTLDFNHPAAAAVGDLVVTVSRLGKQNDAMPYFETARLSGEIAKPRRGWVLDGGSAAIGLPVFAAAGGVVGVMSVLAPGGGDGGDDDAESMGSAFNMMAEGLAGGGPLIQRYIVPAPAIAAVIDQARQQAAQKAAERAAKPVQPATPPAAPAPPPPGL